MKRVRPASGERGGTDGGGDAVRVRQTEATDAGAGDSHLHSRAVHVKPPDPSPLAPLRTGIHPDRDAAAPAAPQAGVEAALAGATAPSGGDGALDSASAVVAGTGPAAATASAAGAPVAAAQPAPRDPLPWDDYFMGIALLSALRSKDPSTQVGACVVDARNRIVGLGYNGFPRGCPDDQLPWARRADDPLDTKYPYVCHAEVNAIMNKNSASVEGCRMYVALFPCNDCAKVIIQSGIREVVFLSDKYHDDPPFVASRRLLDLAGVRYRQHTRTVDSITVDFDKVD